MAGRYEDIIHLPHPVSKTHPQMSLQNRAAQFAPFAALTGYGDAVEETARYTETKAEITEEQQARINEALEEIQARLGERPLVEVVHFVPDRLKEGGQNEVTTGVVKRLDPLRKVLVMEEGPEIEFADLIRIVLRTGQEKGQDKGNVPLSVKYYDC